MKKTGSLLLAVGLGVSLCACKAPAEPTATPETTPASAQYRFTRDTFPRLDGSTATVPLGQAVAAALLGESREEAADLIHFNKTSRAYYNLVDGEADLLLVAEGGEDSYAYRDDNGKTWRMEPIAAETLVFFVNADNPVEGLTLDQVRDIYAGKITNWSEVGGTDAPIQAYQRPAGGGSQAIMEKEVMGETPMMEPSNAEYVVASMEGIVQAVRAWDGQPDAMGYTVYYYASDMGMADGLKLLSIDGVAPTDETIRDGSYPIHTAYYAVMDAETPADSPTGILFDWLLSQEGQNLIAHEGYVSVLAPTNTAAPLSAVTEVAPPPMPTQLDHTYTYLAPNVGLERAILNTGDYHLSCFFEIPRFEETAPAYEAINAFFQDLSDAFFDPENEAMSAQSAWDNVTAGRSEDCPYHFERAVREVTQADAYISVYQDWYWYMGGVNDTGGDCYNFDPATGRRLYLSDLIEGSEADTLGLIRQVVEENGYEWDYVNDYALDDFDFFIAEGKVFLQFDRYEIAAGAAGSSVLELPVTLKA